MILPHATLAPAFPVVLLSSCPPVSLLYVKKKGYKNGDKIQKQSSESCYDPREEKWETDRNK